MAIIGIDATHLSLYGKGVSRYQEEIIKNLSRIDKKNQYHVFLNKKNALPNLPLQDNFHYIKTYKLNQIIWDQLQAPVFIKKNKLDIYHVLIDTLPVRSRAKLLLAVNEIPDYRIELAKKSPLSLYARLSQEYNKIFFRKSLARANMIIAISNSTKSDLINIYGVNENKIRVIYHGVDECFNAARNESDILLITKKYNTGQGYILHISTNDQRDNTFSVIRAYYNALPKLRIKKKLVIAGNVNPERTELRKLIVELNLAENVIFTGYLLKDELVSLYQAADLYVDPSLYEGFGLQVLEAMACGIPVIASNATSLPEVTSNAAILISPDDTNAIAGAMVSVLNEPQLRQSMCQKSIERAKFFSWEKAARETLGIYNELLCA